MLDHVFVLTGKTLLSSKRESDVAGQGDIFECETLKKAGRNGITELKKRAGLWMDHVHSRVASSSSQPITLLLIYRETKNKRQTLNFLPQTYKLICVYPASFLLLHRMKISFSAQSYTSATEIISLLALSDLGLC